MGQTNQKCGIVRKNITICDEEILENNNNTHQMGFDNNIDIIYVKHGMYKLYHENGNPHMIAYFKNNVCSGNYILFDEDGNATIKKYYTSGIEFGPRKIYNYENKVFENYV